MTEVNPTTILTVASCAFAAYAFITHILTATTEDVSIATTDACDEWKWHFGDYHNVYQGCN
jgi:hypothetical protein